MLSTEIRAKHGRDRLLYAAAGGIVAHMTALLTLYWVTQQIRDAGMPAWGIALLCLVVLGGGAALLFHRARDKGAHPAAAPARADLPVPSRRTAA